ALFVREAPKQDVTGERQPDYGNALALIVFLRQLGQGQSGNSLFVQGLSFLQAGLAVDVALFLFAVMDLAGLFRKVSPDIVGVGLQMRAQALQEGIGLFPSLLGK